ncbi:MAG: cupin domain-containing protein [Deltaproteobacteria bacterium]|nr:cupin domain-containing protein [Deltaproteobacteria bacterium]
MTTRCTAEALIQHFQLQPHPEGGFFRETFRDGGTIPQAALPKRFSGDRSFSTAIYFLLPEGKRSQLHRITADELWHFYLGDPLVVVEIRPDGRTTETLLGHDVLAGQCVQHVVPAGHWFGAYPAPGSRFSFVGCTVAPGFDFADFEMGEREALLRQFPQARDVVERLT